MRTCVEDGCERRHYGRSWCKFHYQRAHLAGRLEDRPRKMVPAGSTLDERLRHHGWDERPYGCWEWRGDRSNKGYGQLATGGSRPMLAHRAAYQAWIGALPHGQIVRHRCDNPVCVNPEHLVLGTRRDNASDAVARHRTSNGERRSQHKLTDVQVVEIRQRYARGDISQRALAAEFEVCQQLISHLVRHTRRSRPTNPPLAAYSPVR